MKGAEKLAGKAAEILLAGCVAGLAGFIGMQTFTVRGSTAHGEAAGAIATTIAPASGMRATKAGQPQLAGTLASAHVAIPSPGSAGNAVVPLDQLERETVAWCREMSYLSPMSLRLLKASFNAEEDGLSGLQQLSHDATLLFYMTEEGQ